MSIESIQPDPEASGGVTVDPAPRGPRPARAKRKKKSYARWIGLGLLAAVIALIVSTVRPGQGAFVYSKYVDEVLAEPQRYVNTELRVEGIVAAGTVHNRAGSRDYEFSIERNRRTMPVRYTGIIPDTFREGIGVTVRGRLQASGTFIANEVVAKCPSKYEMQAARARGAQMPPGMLNGGGTPAAAPQP